MEAGVARVQGSRYKPPLSSRALDPAGAQVTLQSARLSLLADGSPGDGALLDRLLRIAQLRLAEQHDNGEFVFTVTGEARPGGGWQLRRAGTSLRYGAITALGLMRLPEPDQRTVLAGMTAEDLVGYLAKQVDGITGLGDAALVCWAAAEGGHTDLGHALERLAALDQPERPVDVVSAAWVVSALVAARPLADVEPHLAAARQRLLAARGPAVYPHATGPGAPWYRAHVGSFADQVYPIQALARLHRSADDPEALAVAGTVAGAICSAQGAGGQWWWHYDSRSGAVVEGYPVYSVHQHAMGPMALLDLADAGGDGQLDAIRRGLRWLTGPPEAAGSARTGQLILDDPPITWRKVARADHRKVVRGLRAASTRIIPGARVGALDRVYPPGVVDHECRPYELGWLLYTWLS
ncbi:MAG: hypothetical protein QOG05_4822 [Streptosporangiaceae bacterium]|nr:hypothetical protein [Streptosporangiaceae bacterium]